MRIEVEYTDKSVTPWGGMLQMKQLLDATKIREKLLSLNLPEGKSLTQNYSRLFFIQPLLLSPQLIK